MTPINLSNFHVVKTLITYIFNKNEILNFIISHHLKSSFFIVAFMQVINCDCFVYHGLHTQKKKKVVPFSYFSIHDQYISICDNNNDTISSNVS